MAALTKDQFGIRVPRYIDSGFEYASAIIERGLDDPDGDIEVQLRWMGKATLKTDPEEVRGIWERRDDLGPEDEALYFRVSAAIEGLLGMAINYTPNEGSPTVAVWNYRTVSSYERPSLVADHTDVARPEPVSARNARTDPEAFTTQPLFFRRNLAGDGTSLWMEFYSKHGPVTGLPEPRDWYEITPEDYTEVGYPPLSERERQILGDDGRGLYSLHDFKVRRVLRVMEAVARR